MKTRIGILCLIGGLLLGWSLIALGQELPPSIRILVVDETKTFTSTMKVAGTIGALRQMGLFEVAVQLADVETDFEDPLAGKTPESDQDPFDLILILPRGLDTKTNVSIWLVSNGFHSLSPFVRGAVELVSNVVDQVFAGSGQTIDVSEDLWPSFLWAVYVSKGWIQ
ncbi:hypothetical protein KAT84_02195 [Candidatus Bipolaricaulota bacterium]|nr:hypothetical protein [Candidatus Bipolaricaulota bacterium]